MPPARLPSTDHPCAYTTLSSLQMHDIPPTSTGWDTPFDACCMVPAQYVAPSPSPSPSPSVSPSVSPSPTASATKVFGCPRGYSMQQATGRCYAAVGVGAGGITWTNAAAACRALDPRGSLAAIRSAAEKTLVVDNRCAGLVPATGTNGVPLFWWVGLSDALVEVRLERAFLLGSGMQL